MLARLPKTAWMGGMFSAQRVRRPGDRQCGMEHPKFAEMKVFSGTAFLLVNFVQTVIL
jgi:hypothetical protein